jgi:pimeloyl-ACP methyl ester carboxylesterase
LSRELTQLVPGARYEEIERAGHLTNLERAEEFNALVDAFIGNVDSGS